MLQSQVGLGQAGVDQLGESFEWNCICLLRALELGELRQTSAPKREDVFVSDWMSFVDSAHCRDTSESRQHSGCLGPRWPSNQDVEVLFDSLHVPRFQLVGTGRLDEVVPSCLVSGSSGGSQAENGDVLSRQGSVEE